MRSFTTIVIAIAAAHFSTALIAQTAGSAPAAAAPAASAAAKSEPMTLGEVRKIDKSTSKVTLRHEALLNLGMPPMTMAFRAVDPQMLDSIKQGDKVRFVADKVDGQFIVTKIELAN